MDPIEKAIRNALQKGDAGDRAFREKVYRSAFAALERATRSQPQLTVEAAIRRRQNLQAKVTAIEAEYLPVPSSLSHPGHAPEVSVDTGHGAGEQVAPPSLDAPAPDAVRREEGLHEAPLVAPPVALGGGDGAAPAVDIAAPGSDGDRDRMAGKVAATVAPDRDERRAGSRRRRPLAAAFLILTFLCIAVIGALWAYQTGLLSRGGYVPMPPQLSEEEDFDPGPEVPLQPGGDREMGRWTSVFSPGDLSGVNAPTGATAEIDEDESGRFLRIRSGDAGASIVFDVSQDVLESIAGKKAVFNISARTEEGSQTQISVSCDFGELGDCGRKRYAVGYERGEYLFDVSLPANPPGAGGSIAINSDFSNEGRSVDIYEIRVSVIE